MLGAVSGAAIRVPGVSGWAGDHSAGSRALAGVSCDLLGRDQGRMLGSAVLFASVVGLDVVEQRKGTVAAISGVPATRIQEIVWAAVSVATSMRAWPEGPAPRLTTSSHKCGEEIRGQIAEPQAGP